MEIVRLLTIGFGFGIKHAVEADHVAAVSTFSARTHHVAKSLWTGIVWGFGHTLILLFAGILLLLFRVEIPERVSMILEFGVGVMLIYLGVRNLFARDISHAHPHIHTDGSHTHKHFHTAEPRSLTSSFLVGMVHGLAGSGSFVLVFLANIKSTFVGIMYILIFGLGSIGAMALMSLVISIPVIVSSKAHNKIERYIRLVSGLVSALLGAYIMYEIGFVEGLFVL